MQRQHGPLLLVTTGLHKSFVMVICQMTSGRGGLHLWKCLYLARNVTKGNNVLSQSTLMDLATISAAALDHRDQRDHCQQGSITLDGRTATDRCLAPPLCLTQRPIHQPQMWLSDHMDYRPLWHSSWAKCMIAWLKNNEFHLKLSLHADNTAAELNVSSGRVCVCVCDVSCVYFCWDAIGFGIAWPHIDCIGYWSVTLMGWVCTSARGRLLTDNCRSFDEHMCECTHTHTCTHCCFLLEFLDLPHSCLEG